MFNDRGIAYDPLHHKVLFPCHGHLFLSDSDQKSVILHTFQWTRAVARWPGGQLPPQLALKRGRQTDDRGAPAAKQITRNVFN